jgi:hypothetical protein
MRSGVSGHLFAAALLTLFVGAQLVEMSGHWDRSLQDANDEAGLVAIVLCVGVALSAAATLLNRLGRRTLLSQIVPTSRWTPARRDRRSRGPILASGPPASLRV